MRRVITTAMMSWAAWALGTVCTRRLEAVAHTAALGPGGRNQVKMSAVLDHASMQCADVAASAAFYDLVRAPLGGERLLDFGEVIGCGVAPRPDFWLASTDGDTATDDTATGYAEAAELLRS